MKNLRTIVMAGLMVSAILGACRKDQMDRAANTASNEPNSMTVRLTDNPGDYLGLKMEIVRVDAYLEGSGWVTLSEDAQVVDVVRLTNGNTATIAFKNELQAGNYTKLKLVFGTENKITVMVDAQDGSGLRIAQETTIAYVGEKEVIVEIDAQVNASTGAEVLVDFDVARSVVTSLKGYVVTPVITWIRDVKTAVTGDVNGAISAAIILTNGKDTVSAYTDIEGKFYLRGMQSGVYDLVIYPAKKTIFDAMQKPMKIEGVIVTEGEVKYLGAIEVQ
jgi:hypothetical protein